MLVLLAAHSTAGAMGTLDQSQTTLGGSFSNLGGSIWRAQTFTAGISGDLDQVDLPLARQGSPGLLTVEVRTTSAAAPSSTVLASATVSEVSVPVFPSSAEVSVPLSAPAPVTAGVEYAIVLLAPSGGNFGGELHVYSWAGTALPTNPYPGGTEVESVNGGASWTISNPDHDQGFKTYVVPNSSPDCSAVTASPTVIQAASLQLRLVGLGGATDPDGDTVALTVTGVTQDEPLTGGEDKTRPDALSSDTSLGTPPSVAALLDNDPHQVYLRAERRNSGNGRVYRILFSGSDGRGGSCSGQTKLSVPRRSGVAAVDSAPPSNNSFGP